MSRSRWLFLKLLSAIHKMQPALVMLVTVVLVGIIKMPVETSPLKARTVRLGGAECTCRQQIPAELIQQLMRKTKILIASLPMDNKIYKRILPKFCTACDKNVVGWWEVRQILQVYGVIVSRASIQSLYPQHYGELLHRLNNTLQHCAVPSKPSRSSKIISKIQKNIKTLFNVENSSQSGGDENSRLDRTAFKAIGEFTIILRWINELREHYVI